MDTCVYGVIHAGSGWTSWLSEDLEPLYRWNQECASRRCFLGLHLYTSELPDAYRDTLFHGLPAEAAAFHEGSVCFELSQHPFSLVFEPEPHSEDSGPQTPMATQLASLLSGIWDHELVRGVFLAVPEGGWNPHAAVHRMSFIEAMKHYYEESRLGAFADDFAYLIQK